MDDVVCAFCGEDNAMSREHALPGWILRHLDRQGGAPLGLSGRYGPRGHEAAFDIANAEIVAEKGVCLRCNTHWMQNLEDKVIPFLRPLIDGQQAKLSLSRRRMLSRWCVKTAATIELFHHRVSAIEQDARSFVRERGEPPKSVVVVVGHYDWHSRSDVDYQFGRVRLKPNPLGAGEAFLSTIRIRRFVSQVTGAIGGGVMLLSGYGAPLLPIWPPAPNPSIGLDRLGCLMKTSVRSVISDSTLLSPLLDLLKLCAEPQAPLRAAFQASAPTPCAELCGAGDQRSRPTTGLRRRRRRRRPSSWFLSVVCGAAASRLIPS
jgi:hypothetical protein